VSALLVPIAGLVDMAMLGHLDSISHLAGVALASVIFDYLYWGFGFLRMTTTGLTAQAVGRNDVEEIYATALRGLVLAGAIGFLILLLAKPISMAGFGLLVGEPDVERAGMAYFDARVLAAPATLLNFVFIGWFLGRERSDIVLLLSAIGNLSNIVLDYLFIFEWGWESWGAGLATAISQYLLLMVAVGLALRHSPPGGLSEAWAKAKEGTRVRDLLVLNGDMMLRTLVLQTTFAVFTNVGALMGTVALAGNAVLLKVLSLASYFIDGYAYALESLVGIFHAQKKLDALREVLKHATLVSIGTGLGVVALFVLFPETLFGLLTNHEDVLTFIVGYAPWLFAVVGVGAVAYALDGYFIGLTAAHTMRQTMFVAAGLGFAPFAALAAGTLNNHILWSSMVAFMLLRAIGLGRSVESTWTQRAPS